MHLKAQKKPLDAAFFMRLFLRQAGRNSHKIVAPGLRPFLAPFNVRLASHPV